METLVLLGAPGSGKGTAAAALSADAGWRHVSTGDLCREAMARGTAWGKAIRPHMERGELVPDGLALDRVGELLREAPADQRILFDGFPRTLGQAEAFNDLLAAQGARLLQVILLDASPETLEERLGARLGCEACGTIYNLLTRPPHQAGTCDACGAPLSQRNDDRVATVRRRLEIYEEQTAPLVDYYEQRGLLRRVDAGKAPQDVARHIRLILTTNGQTDD